MELPTIDLGQQATTTPATPTDVPENKTNMKLVGGVAVVILLILAGLSIYLYTQNQSLTTQVENLTLKVSQLEQDGGNSGNTDANSGDGDDSDNTNNNNSGSTSPDDVVNVKVHFSKKPESYETDFTFTVGVDRQVIRGDAANLAMRELFNGPTDDEKDDDLVNPIIVSGASNCGGSSVSVKTTEDEATESNNIEVKICKNLTINGVADTARIKSVIENTLKGLEESIDYKVGKIAILDKASHCVGDESGTDSCKF
jgi:hypothetical protein